MVKDLCCIIPFVLSEIIGKLFCNTEALQHVGDIVYFTSDPLGVGGYIIFIGLWLFPCQEKEQKRIERRIFTLRVESSYIK